MSESAVSAPQSKPTFSAVAAGLRGWVVNPWGKPRFLVLITWAYMLWAIVPVLIADPVLVQRQPLAHRLAGLLDPVVLEQPVDSVWNDPALRDALVQSLKLAALDMIIADADRRRAGARPRPLAGARLGRRRTS